MKKVLFLICLLLTSMSVSAQFLKIDKVSTTLQPGRMTWMRVYLSNGDILSVWSDGLVSSKSFRRASTNMKCGGKYPVGGLVYNTGSLYEYVTPKKIMTRTIKYVKIHTVSSKMVSKMVGDYSYRAIAMLGSKADASVTASSSGGQETIANVVFDDNSSTSISVCDDPIWLEAKVGQKVEHYKLKHLNVYKLLF